MLGFCKSFHWITKYDSEEPFLHYKIMCEKALLVCVTLYNFSFLVYYYFNSELFFNFAIKSSKLENYGKK